MKKNHLIEEVTDEVKEKASEIKDYVKDKFQDQRAHLSHEAKRYSEKGKDKLEHAVKSNPVKAVGIAALVGTIFGFLLRRKKK